MRTPHTHRPPPRPMGADMTPEEVLTVIGAIAGRHGMVVPTLDSPQARRAAAALLAAVGLQRATPAPALPPPPVSPAIAGAPTQLLPLVRSHRRGAAR